jgi:hypothetical protein
MQSQGGFRQCHIPTLLLTVGGIQGLLEKRISFVNDLKAAVEAEQLLKLSQDQVDAVKRTLANELKRESRSSFWKSVAVNFLFFIGGAIVSYIVSKLPQS